MVFLLGFYHMEIQFSLLFFLKWIWNTRYFTPDNDTHSKPTKRLGPIGWIIDKLFHHRGWLHSPIFWAVLFALEYHFIGAWTLGGLVPVASHLITDKL